MTTTEPMRRITDELIGEADPVALFQSGELLAEMRKKLAERILDAELVYHLSQSAEQVAGNVRSGHNAKTVLPDNGPKPLEVPRDRQGSFAPRLVEKYCRRLLGFDDKVIDLFARRMSVRRIREIVKELYGVEVLVDLFARVTDAVMEEFNEWQNRPLADTYAIVYLDAIYVKVREAGSVVNRVVYLALGVDE